MVLAVPGTTLPPLGLTTNFIISRFSIYFLHSFFEKVIRSIDGGLFKSFFKNKNLILFSTCILWTLIFLDVYLIF